jgi:endonuclease/exonuclease/phosphatase family metal-dependent hydrolase
VPLQTLRFNSAGPIPSDVGLTLRALETALDSNVPSRQLDRNLLVASWNIRGLGGYTPKWTTTRNDSPKRNLADLHYIAEIISRFDIVAVQETKDNLEALRIIMSLLGPDWGLLMSDVTYGDKGNFERLGYVFDMRRVRPSGLAGELVLSPEQLKALRKVREAHPFPSDDVTDVDDPAKREQIQLEREFGGQIDRTPYIASFMTAGRPFMLATVHIVWGKQGDVERRAEETGLLADLLLRAIEGPDGKQPDDFRANLLALGDFNVERDDDPIVAALTQRGMATAEVLADKRRTTSDRPGGGGKIAYDQFAWFPPATNLPGALRLPVLQGDSFPWDDHILSDAASKDFRISDHYPLWLELSVRTG